MIHNIRRGVLATLAAAVLAVPLAAQKDAKCEKACTQAKNKALKACSAKKGAAASACKKSAIDRYRACLARC